MLLVAHLLWIAWAILGAFLTRGRPFWTALHLGALLWGIAVEVGPWPCPLTLVENLLELRAGVQPATGGFLLHCLDATVYPDVSYRLVTVCGVTVCALNLAVYAWRLRVWWKAHRRG